MANANQVIVNGETILDLRSDTVTPETLQKGYTAHDKSGKKITGTLEASSVSVQPSKSVTITSNGIVSVPPDASYDALKKVDVAVDVATYDSPMQFILDHGYIPYVEFPNDAYNDAYREQIRNEVESFIKYTVGEICDSYDRERPYNIDICFDEISGAPAIIIS